MVECTDINNIYSDDFGKQLIKGYIYPPWNLHTFNANTNVTESNSLVFLRSINVDGHIMVPAKEKTFEKPYAYESFRESDFGKYIESSKSRIYNNNNSEVWM